MTDASSPIAAAPHSDRRTPVYSNRITSRSPTFPAGSGRRNVTASGARVAANVRSARRRAPLAGSTHSHRRADRGSTATGRPCGPSTTINGAAVSRHHRGESPTIRARVPAAAAAACAACNESAGRPRTSGKVTPMARPTVSSANCNGPPRRSGAPTPSASPSVASTPASRCSASSRERPSWAARSWTPASAWARADRTNAASAGRRFFASIVNPATTQSPAASVRSMSSTSQAPTATRTAGLTSGNTGCEPSPGGPAPGASSTSPAPRRALPRRIRIQATGVASATDTPSARSSRSPGGSTCDERPTPESSSHAPYRAPAQPWIAAPIASRASPPASIPAATSSGVIGTTKVPGSPVTVASGPVGRQITPASNE